MFKQTFLDVMLERVFYFQQSSNRTKDIFTIDMKKQKDLAFISSHTFSNQYRPRIFKLA